MTNNLANNSKTTLTLVSAGILVCIYSVLIQLFTNFHTMQHGDSLILSIMSYTNPTLYYWGQDQYLNFLPIVISWVQNPVYNLLFLTSIQLSVVMLFPFVAGKLLAIEKTLLFGLIALSCLLIFNKYFWFELCYQPYAVSFILVMISMLFYLKFISSTRPMSKVVMLLSSLLLALFAVKIAQTSIVILFLWTTYLSFESMFTHKLNNSFKAYIEKAKEKGRHYILWILAFYLFYLVFAFYEKYYFTLHPVTKRVMVFDPSVVHAVKTLMALLRNMAQMYVPYPNFLGILCVIVIVLYVLLMMKKRYSTIWSSLVLFVIPAIIIAVVMSSLEWVRLNSNMPRYIAPSVLLIILNLAYLAVESLKMLSISPRLINVSAVVLFSCLVVFIPLKFQMTSFLNITDRILHQQHYEESMHFAPSLDGVIGNYWKVWPTVWLANARGDRDFIGVSYRSDNILDKIKQKLFKNRKLKLLAYPGDPDVENMLTAFFKNALIRRYDTGSLVIVEITDVPWNQ